MDNHIAIVKNNLKRIDVIYDLLVNAFEESRIKIDPLIDLYDNTKVSKQESDLCGKLCLISTKYDDYEYLLDSIGSSKLSDIYDYVEVDEKITKNSLRKANTSKKYFSTLIDKINNNVNKLKKVCNELNINTEEYVSKILLYKLEDIKQEYCDAVNEILKVFERGDLV